MPIPYTKGGITGLQLNITEMANKATGDLSGMFGSLRNTLVGSLAFRRALMEEAKTEEKPTTEEAIPITVEEKPLSTSPGTRKQSQYLSNNSLMDDGLRTPPEPLFTTDEILSTLNPKKRRVDFALHEYVLENPYLSALGVHMAYWKDVDCALFLLREIMEE